MAGNALSRKTVRDQIRTVYSTDLTGSDKPFQAIYSYDRRLFKGQSPVLLILSEGVRRERMGIGTDKYFSTFRFALLIFVADADPNNNWTEQNVEDKLDECEQALADCVIDHKKEVGKWHDSYFASDFSEVFDVTLMDGNRYKLERATLIVEAHDA
jgi:hypothetical protein